MAGIFSYAKTLWQDGVTAITAARLNHIEQGISDAADSIKTLGDSVSPLAFESGCSVRFLNSNGMFGIQIKDPATGDYGFIAITKESKIRANVNVGGQWVESRTL